MRLLITTVIRHSKLGEQSTGRLLEVDWPTGKIAREMSTPDPRHPTSNLNPRGGLRGGRGLCRRDRVLYVANYDTVYAYDESWNLQGKMSHPLTTDIHEIDVDSDGVWITCSSYDLVVKLDFAGKLVDSWHIAQDPDLVQLLGVPATTLDLSKDYRVSLPTGLDHTHLNSVQAVGPNCVVVGLGRVIPSSFRSRVARRLIPMRDPSRLGLRRKRWLSRFRGTRSYVLRVTTTDRDPSIVLAECPTLRPCHNGGTLPDGRTVLLHESCELRIGEKGRGERMSSIEIPADWVRGLAVIDDSRVLVGTGPCGIVEVDHRQGRVERVVRLSDNPNESVHGLELLEPD